MLNRKNRKGYTPIDNISEKVYALQFYIQNSIYPSKV